MITGLMRCRSELAGQVSAMSDQLDKLMQDLAAIDAALSVVAPDVKITAIRPHMARPREAILGDAIRPALEVLRSASAPLTGRDIAAQIMAASGLDPKDQKLLRAVAERVSRALRNQRKKGLVRSTGKVSGLTLWVVAG